MPTSFKYRLIAQVLMLTQKYLFPRLIALRFLPPTNKSSRFLRPTSPLHEGPAYVLREIVAKVWLVNL